MLHTFTNEPIISALQHRKPREVVTSVILVILPEYTSYTSFLQKKSECEGVGGETSWYLNIEKCNIHSVGFQSFKREDAFFFKSSTISNTNLITGKFQLETHYIFIFMFIFEYYSSVISDSDANLLVCPVFQYSREKLTAVNIALQNICNCT